MINSYTVQCTPCNTLWHTSQCTLVHLTVHTPHHVQCTVYNCTLQVSEEETTPLLAARHRLETRGRVVSDTLGFY